MYKCQKCKKTTAPNEKTNTIVTETRQKKYFKVENSFDEDGNPITVQGKLQGIGTETVTEKRVCDDCYDRHISTQYAMQRLTE